MNTPTITTHRLTLRPFTLEDTIPLHEILSEEGVLRYFPNPNPPKRESVKKFIAAQLNHWEEHGFGWWAVESGDKREFIGWNGLQQIPETDEVEVGFLLKKSCWGKGLATEGAFVGLQFGFKTLDMDTIIAVVHPENAASQRVIEKLGMGFVEQTQYFGIDVYRYLIDADSFKQRDD